MIDPHILFGSGLRPCPCRASLHRRWTQKKSRPFRVAALEVWAVLFRTCRRKKTRKPFGLRVSECLLYGAKIGRGAVTFLRHRFIHEIEENLAAAYRGDVFSRPFQAGMIDAAQRNVLTILKTLIQPAIKRHCDSPEKSCKAHETQRLRALCDLRPARLAPLSVRRPQAIRPFPPSSYG